MRGRSSAAGLSSFVVSLVLVAGCSGTATGSPTTAASSTAPGPASSSAGTGQTNGPIAHALVAILQADPFVAHLALEDHFTVTTSSGSTSPPSTNSMSADVSGDDCVLRVTMQGSDGRTTGADSVIVGGTQYYRESGGAWRSVPATTTAGDMVKRLLPLDDPGILQDVGVEAVNGRQLHHLVPTTMPPYATSQGAGTYEAYDIWAQDDGTPVVIQASYTITGDAGALTKGTVELRLTNVGQPVAISAPSIGLWSVPPVADWLAYTGPGVRIHYPPDWSCYETNDVPGAECVAPGSYPFLQLWNQGSVPGGSTLATIAKAVASSNERDLDSKDVTSSSIAVGDDTAIQIRFHNTGSTGIEYYTVKALTIHAATLYEVTLYSKAGRESDSDALFTQFLAALEFTP
jgi:hypothetical protein